MMKPVLKFAKNQIPIWASRYEYSADDTELLDLKASILRRGHLTKAELVSVAYWKAPRSAGYARDNSEEYVSEVTRFAFETDCERARIQSLTLLDGVSWPTASVLLHFFHPEPYPILDFRAIWSVSLEEPSQYRFVFWWNYVEFCRNLTFAENIDMRTLDRALWQYSKENQSTA